MIGRIHGIILEKSPAQLLIDVTGVGYNVEVSMNTYARLPDANQKVTLHTHFIVREDAQLLYGFYDKHERTLFCSLIKINGVGPKSALAILSSITPEDFQQCVANNDTAALVRLPGVGKKTAERLLIEMRDKLNDWQINGNEPYNANSNTIPSFKQAEKEAVEALIALGYKPQDASKSISRIYKENLSSEEMIRLALQGK